MSKTFIWISNIANIVGVIIVAAIIIVAVLFHIQRKKIPSIEVVKKNISYCKSAAIILLVCAWLLVTGDTPEKLAEGYQAVSKTCISMGILWMVMGFVNIAAQVFVQLKMEAAHGSLNSLPILVAIRNSTIGMGIGLLVMGFLLTV